MLCTRTAARSNVRRAGSDIALFLQRSALMLALTWLFATTAEANPGDLDPTFAGFAAAGQFLTDLSIKAIAVQPDGKTVFVGYDEPSGQRIHVVRLLMDGSPDPTFGNNGLFQLTPLFPTFPTSVAIQPDGKIVMAGYEIAPFSSPIPWVGRVTATGQLDTSFGELGRVIILFFQVDYQGSLSSVLVQPDGKIVVAGSAVIAGDFDFAVARLLPNGAFDNSFGGGDGMATIPFGDDDHCTDVALQSDGKLVLVGGILHVFFDDDFAIARLRPDGTLDTGFDGDGKATAGFGGDEIAKSVSIQADGNIVVAGGGLTGDGCVARYRPNGSLDPSLDGDGKVTIQENTCEDVAVQPDGRILLIGSHESPDGDLKFTIHRRLPDGAVDLSFQGDGDLLIDIGDIDTGRHIELYPDGRFLVSGATDLQYALIRMWPDGSYDVGGQQTISFNTSSFPPGSNEDVYGMAVQSDGRVVLVGTVTTALGTQSDVALARFLPDGELDATFGDNGRVALDVGTSDIGRAVAIQSDGKIVVAGYTGTGNIQFLAARFNSNGTRDNSFGDGGYSLIDFASGPDYANAVGIAPDGKIVLAGVVASTSGVAFGAARFNSNGSVDTFFNGSGKKTVAFPGATSQWASTVLVQPDSKILLGGHADFNFALMRFNPNGTMDRNFGSNGFVSTEMGGSDAIHALALDAIGRIYAAGGGGPNVDFALAQYNSNGVLFTCTPPPVNCGWSSGKVLVDWGGYETAWAIDVRSDGRVVAAGCVNGLLGWAQLRTTSEFNPLKVTTDFAGDIQCETGGEFPTSGGAGVQYLFSDKLMVAATQNYEGNRNMALASFETDAAPVSDSQPDDEVASPRGVILEAAFPNPARQSCAVTFNLQQAQSARLRVFDVAGRLVRTLADESFAAGRHRLLWDRTDQTGRSVAAGVYFLRLDAGEIHERRSVVVVR